MNSNDVFRSLRHILNINEAVAVDIFKLADYQIDQATVTRFSEEVNDAGCIQCSNNQMSLFLDGLITHRRGKILEGQNESKKIILPLSNNSIIKKLRIAFDLREHELIQLMSLAEFEISKNDLTAIFRKPGHKHYRECSDEFLMAFLVGLTFKQWS